jgi:hypothetical protein
MGPRYARFLICFLVSFPVLAQSPLGTVTGLALDPAGSPVTAAVITLSAKDTGGERRVTTNGSGAYTLPDLKPGNYQLSAEAPGFAKFETIVFELRAYQTVRQDLHFQLPGQTSSVTVSEAAASVLQIDSPAVAQSLTTKQILELPTNVRGVWDNSGDSGLLAQVMPLTIPGVVQVGAGAAWLTPGARANGVKVLVDGIDADFGNFGEADPVSQPSMEAVQQFTVNSVANRAEFGGQSTVITVTKAGTNQYHGDLFEYVRNTFLDARNPFYIAKQTENLHDYGGSFSGPIIHNKTFLFFNVEEYQGVQSYPTPPTAASVPSLAYRAGNFSNVAALKNPYGSPFPGNVIPASLLSPQALKAQQLLYPLPNFGAPTLLAGNFRASYSGADNERMTEGRIDHNFSDRHSAFARYALKQDNYVIPGARSVLPASSTGTSTNIRTDNFGVIGDTYTITPNLVNEARLGVVVLSSKSYADLSGQGLLNAIGISGLPDRTGIHGIPNFTITGFSTVTESLLNPVNDGHAQVSDSLSWIAGKHSFKFGGQYVNWFDNRYLTSNAALFGNYSFSGQYTGNAYADFLLGLPSSVARLDPYQQQYNRFWDLSFFAQDDYKVTPRLTLSYGLRYEYNSPFTATDGNVYSFDLANGSVVVPNAHSETYFSKYFPASIPVITAAQANIPASLRESNKLNFAPRFGFSYQLDKSGKTVVRGGWGLYYLHFSADLAAFLATGPYSFSTTITNPASAPAYTLANPFSLAGTAGSVTLNAIAPNLRVPYAMELNFSIERELARNLGLRVSFVQNNARQLVYERNVNQPQPSTSVFAQSSRPYPLYANITYADSGANSDYNALQVAISKRLSRGLSFESAFVWEKELSDIDDTGDSEVNTAIENAYNRARDRANVYSVPHYQWLNQALYELPFGKAKWFGGWQFNTLINMQTGNWLNPQFSGVDPSGTNNSGGRPNVAAPLDYPKTLAEWFNPADFSIPLAKSGVFGNAGRNIIQGPGFIIVNLGASKTVSLERYGKLQFGVSFANVLNHLNYGQPTTLASSAPQNGTGVLATGTNAGVISSTAIFPAAGTPRTGLLSLRWSF